MFVYKSLDSDSVEHCQVEKRRGEKRKGSKNGWSTSPPKSWIRRWILFLDLFIGFVLFLYQMLKDSIFLSFFFFFFWRWSWRKGRRKWQSNWASEADSINSRWSRHTSINISDMGSGNTVVWTSCISEQVFWFPGECSVRKHGCCPNCNSAVGETNGSHSSDQGFDFSVNKLEVHSESRTF